MSTAKIFFWASMLFCGVTWGHFQLSKSQSALGTMVDDETGCEYVVLYRGAGITPRLNANGFPMCDQVPQKPRD